VDPADAGLKERVDNGESLIKVPKKLVDEMIK